MDSTNRKPTDERVALAQRLFEEFYARCFWHMPQGFIVRPVDLTAIIKGLRTYGGRRGFIAASLLTTAQGRRDSCFVGHFDQSGEAAEVV